MSNEQIENQTLQEPESEEFETNPQEEGEAEDKQEAEEPSHIKEARSQGWRPKEEFEGDKSEWVDAKPYLKYRKLSNHAHQQTRTINGLKNEMSKVSKLLLDLNQNELTKTEASLKLSRDEAIEMGDKQTVDKIDDTLAAVRQRQHDLKQSNKQNGQGPTEEAELWYEDNKSWFRVDDEMTDYAVELDNKLPQLYPNASVADILEMIDKRVRKKFPDHFEPKTKKVTTMSVERPSLSRVPPKNKGYKDLDPKAKDIAKEFADMSGVEGDERAKYLEDYAKDYFKQIGA